MWLKRFLPLLVMALFQSSSICIAVPEEDDDEEVNYDKIVDITGIDLQSSSPRRKVIEISFNLHPQIPSGATIEFELEYQALPFDHAQFTLKDEKRRNLKLSWTPKHHLPVDTYFVRTRMPLDAQTAKVVAELTKRQKIFPPDSAPWSWHYPEFPVKVGSPEDQAAETAAVRSYFKTQAGRILALYKDFKAVTTALEEGKDYVSGTKVDTPKLSSFVNKWMSEFGTLQRELKDYELREPGLYRKMALAHFNLAQLAQMVGRKCYKQDLGAALEKYKMNVADLRLKGDRNFDPNWRYRVKPESLNAKYGRIRDLTGFDRPVEEGKKDDKAVSRK